MLMTKNIKSVEMGFSCLAAHICNAYGDSFDDKEWLDGLSLLAERWSWKTDGLKSVMDANYRHLYSNGQRATELKNNPEFIADSKTMTRKQLCKKYHTSLAMVCSIVGVTRRRGLYQDPELCRDAEHMSNRELAQKYNVAWQTVATWRTNKMIPKRIMCSPKICEIGEYCKTHTIAEASRHFGLGWQTVKYRVVIYEKYSKGIM